MEAAWKPQRPRNGPRTAASWCAATPIYRQTGERPAAAHSCSLMVRKESPVRVRERASGEVAAKRRVCTPMVLDAIEMARWNRGLHHEGLRCHSDAGSQFTSIRYGERLAEIGAVPSIGDRRRQLRQRPRRDRQRLLQGRAHQRTRPQRALEDRRRGRARHAQLGALAQHPAPPRLPRGHLIGSLPRRFLSRGPAVRRVDSGLVGGWATVRRCACSYWGPGSAAWS